MNTNPNDTEANAAGISVRACVARKSKSYLRAAKRGRTPIANRPYQLEFTGIKAWGNCTVQYLRKLLLYIRYKALDKTDYRLQKREYWLASSWLQTETFGLWLCISLNPPISISLRAVTVQRVHRTERRIGLCAMWLCRDKKTGSPNWLLCIIILAWVLSDLLDWNILLQCKERQEQKYHTLRSHLYLTAQKING